MRQIFCWRSGNSIKKHDPKKGKAGTKSFMPKYAPRKNPVNISMIVHILGKAIRDCVTLWELFWLG
jgi:hypothetical protein